MSVSMSTPDASRHGARLGERAGLYVPRRLLERMGSRVCVAVLVAVAMLSSLVVPLPAGAAKADLSGTGEVVRLAGDDRYSTSLAVARAFAAHAGGKIDSVVLVSGRSWPDAVIAAGLAGRLNAPILLAGGTGLSAAARSFLDDAGVSEIVVVGNRRAVPSATLDALAGIDPVIERITAPNRYSKSVAVARRIGVPGPIPDIGRTVILASGEVFVDAMVAGTFAARGAHPILLTPRDRLDSEVAGFISSASVDHVVIMGGPNAVSDAVERSVRGFGKETTRLAGASRFETALRAADYVEKRYTSYADHICFEGVTVGLATARVPFDAFTAGPLLGRMCAPLLLTEANSVPAATADRIRLRSASVVVLGGPAAVSPETVSAVSPVAEASAIAEAEAHMVALINDLRSSLGIEPLQLHEGIASVARAWTNTMRDYNILFHNPNVDSDYPAGSRALGENIARAARHESLLDSVQEAFDLLMTSPGHYANMTADTFAHVGVGIAINHRKVWVTQNFADYSAFSPAPPSEPNVKLSIAGDDVTARWSAHSNMQILKWEVDDDSLNGQPTAISHGYSWHDIAEGTYDLSIRACNQAGCSPEHVYTFTIGNPQPPPGSPSRPAIYGTVSDRTIRISWDAQDNASAIDRWTYEEISYATGRTYQRQLASHRRDWSTTGLLPGTYTIRVLAHNAHGTSEWGSASFAVGEP